MGFDNESIINIQSLPGEYFCPVCRQLVYPNEAIQTQCTHLYCKPCLTYVLSTTRACPYDGYLVTDTDSKALQEANPVLADTIGRVPVHCLYHKSGCTWQGPLSESIAHGTGCQYGSSPVVCNRCGTQIVHRQVQEHAQNCPGTQGQVPQQESAPQAQSAAVATAHPEQNQVVQATGQQYAAQTTPQVTQAPVSQPTPYGMGQDQNQGMAAPQTGTQASATDQWYQQQYQQYYQQYPQYDQYQQQYQQYDQYQQQVQAQLQQQVQPQAQVPGQVQAQAQAQLQAQVQPQGQPQPQTQHHPQAHPHPQAQAQAQLQLQTQPQPQAHLHPQPQPQPQPQLQAQAQAHAHAHAHPQLQPQAQAVHASQPYQQGQGHAGLMPQQVQPQHQLMQPQLHQLMPNQSQQIPMQQHPMPVQSQLQPAQQTQQHALNLHQQFQSPQQPQLQQPAHMQQQQPALLTQQLPQQQPQPQQHPQLHQQHQQIVHQPPPQQQLMLQQQIPPQVQQSPHGPVQQHQQFPSQHHQLPQQQQQQAPFFPPPIQAQQPHMQPPFQQATAQPSQMQPPFQPGPQPAQSFPQAFPQSAGHTNAPQQVGSRPPSTQNPGVLQQPFPQSQGRPHPSSYGQTVRGPTKALQAAPNQVAIPNQGAPPSQAFMPRHGQRSQVPHQRPPVHQSALPRPSSQQSLLPGSATPQSMRTGAQTSTTSGAPKLAPALEKPQEINAQDKITKVSQNEHGLQPAKSLQLDEVNDAPGKKKVVETIKAENMMSDKKPEHREQQQANEKVEQKNLSILEPAKSEASDSSQQQMSTKDLQFEKLEPNSQQSVSQKKVHEDLPEKIPEMIADKNSQEPTVHMRDAISEHARHRQDGNMQQYPRQGQETNFLKNVAQKVQEPRRADDKRQSTRSSQDNLQWQEGNILQQASQGQERSLQPPLRQGLIQGQEKNLLQSSRQGPVQAQDKSLQHTSRQGGQDKSLPLPPRQGPVHGQDRNLMQPSRQGQNRSFQQPLRQGSVSGQDRSSHSALQQGPVQGQERSLQQPLQNERDVQQISMQAQVQGHERFQPPRQGQLQGAQVPYSGQPQNADRNFQQLPYQGQPHNISDQFHLSSSKQSGMPSMPMLPQNQPNNMSPFARGHGQVQVPPKHFDIPSPSHLHHQQMVPPRSSQGDSMLGLPLSLSSSMSHHLSSFEGPRGFMDRSLQYGQTLEHSSLSKPMDHMDILGNRRSEVFENKQNDPQQLAGSRFSMTQPSGQQTNIMKPNGASTKGHIEGMQAPAFPPIMAEEGSFRSMQHDSGRQFPDRKEFQDNSRKYKPGQFDGQIPSNPDEMFPPIRHQKGQPALTSKFDQIAPTSRPLEGGPHGFLPDSISKYPFTSAGSPSGGPSRMFPPYQSIGSFPASSGGPSMPSMFNSDSGEGPRFPGMHEEMMGRRPESGGMRPDFMGPRSEFGRNRLDPLAPPRSPGKDYMGMPSGRPNIGPSGGFGPVGGPPHLSHPIEDVNRDPLGFDEQRNKSFGFHSGAVHNVFPSGQLPPGVGNRFPPFHSGPAPGAPGALPNPMMMGDPVANFGVNIPMQGFPGEGGFFKKQGQMPNDVESLDLGRKRKPGSTGWCRICQIDCYTVEGLEQHTQTREHQKRAMDMVLSIKQDSAKRQKISTEDPMSQENGNKTKKASFESRGNRR